MDSNLTERNTKLFGFYFISVLVGVAADQVVKLFVRNPFRNYDFAFSVHLPLWFMYAVYVSILFLVMFFLWKKSAQFDMRQKLAWSAVLAGALSNVGERILLGYVRDYIYFYGGIFNLADLLIIGGIIYLLSVELFPDFSKDLEIN